MKSDGNLVSGELGLPRSNLSQQTPKGKLVFEKLGLSRSNLSQTEIKQQASKEKLIVGEPSPSNRACNEQKSKGKLILGKLTHLNVLQRIRQLLTHAIFCDGIGNRAAVQQPRLYSCSQTGRLQNGQQFLHHLYHLTSTKRHQIEHTVQQPGVYSWSQTDRMLNGQQVLYDLHHLTPRS